MHDDDELMVITEQGKILRMPANDIRTTGRATQGVRLMDLDEGDRVVSIALVPKTEDEPVDESTPADDRVPPGEE